MEQFFLIPIPKDTEFYRGFSEKNKPDGQWFAYDISGASMYGRTIRKYKLKRDIKVINIINGFFHIDFMNHINMMYTGNNFDGADVRKINTLVSIGLPDIEFQQEFMKRIGVSEPDRQIHDDFMSRCLFNKNRLSYYAYDEEFVKAIYTIYGHVCDGWTNPIKYINKFKGNFLERELYIFDLKILELVDEIQLPATGGSTTSVPNYPFGIDPATLKERTNKMMDDLRKELYSKPPMRRDDGIYDRPPLPPLSEFYATPLPTPIKVIKFNHKTRKLKKKTD